MAVAMTRRPPRRPAAAHAAGHCDVRLCRSPPTL